MRASGTVHVADSRSISSQRAKTPARTARSRMKGRESGAGVWTRQAGAARAVRLPDRIAVNCPPGTRAAGEKGAGGDGMATRTGSASWIRNGHRGGTQTAGPGEAVADRTDAPEGSGIRAERSRPVWTPPASRGGFARERGGAYVAWREKSTPGSGGPPATRRAARRIQQPVPMGRAACSRPRSPANKRDPCMGFPPDPVLSHTTARPCRAGRVTETGGRSSRNWSRSR